MKKFNLAILAACMTLCPSILVAQDISQSKKMFYYERWQSTRVGFEKEAATSPEAAYWLTETLLMMGQKGEAKAAAEKANAAFTNNPLSLVALAHISLYDGKTEEAKKNFESALAKAGANNKASILNAIGRAHGNVPLKYSNPDYAIEKLKQAAILEPNNGSIYINMGDCYRKKLDGGRAVEAYTNAQSIEPALTAQANYKIGKIYAGQQNCEVFTRYFNDALKADNNFMPAWRELFENYADRESKCIDFEKARTYFDKYTAAADQGDETEILRANYAYGTKDYNTAITKAQQLLQTMGSKAPVRLYKLIGYSYFEQKDYAKTIQWMENYFSKETNTENIVAHNYRVLAISYDTTGNFSKAKETWIKAGEFEPKALEKSVYYEKAAAIAKKMKDPAGYAAILQQLIDNKPNPTATDYYKCGTAYYEIGNYEAAIPVFDMYAGKYPNDWRPLLWLGRSNARLDSLMKTGAAVPYYENALPMLAKETNTGKIQVEVCLYLFAYEVNFKKDKTKGIEYLDKVLALEPGNATAKQYKEMLTKPGQ